MEALADLFTRLLLLSEHRGPYATGVAWVKADGSLQVAKAPEPARHFVQRNAYLNWVRGIDHQFTYLMGHTRWPSQGSVQLPANNHPLIVPIRETGRTMGNSQHIAVTAPQACLALSHNGTLRNVSRLFSQLGLPRTAEVDSELLIRLAQRHVLDDHLDVAAFLDALAPLEGSLSAALVATSHPEEILLLKGNMPLKVRLHAGRQVLVYASESRILERALDGEAGWSPLPLQLGEGLVINTHAWTLQRVPFVFQGLQTGADLSPTGSPTRKKP